MFAKAKALSGTWKKCTPGTDCVGAIFPPIAIRDEKEPSKDLAVFPVTSKDGKYVPDATTHYSGLVSLVQGCGGNPPECFSTDVWIRLAVTYTMSGTNSCVAQQSFEINANSNFPMTLTVPVGKTIIGFDTFASELPPAAPVWQSCDVWNNGTYSVRDRCVSGPPGAIGFIETKMTNELDGAPGFYNICSNASGDRRRACRIRLRYK